MKWSLRENRYLKRSSIYLEGSPSTVILWKLMHWKCNDLRESSAKLSNLWKLSAENKCGWAMSPANVSEEKRERAEEKIYWRRNSVEENEEGYQWKWRKYWRKSKSKKISAAGENRKSSGHEENRAAKSWKRLAAESSAGDGRRNLAEAWLKYLLEIIGCMLALENSKKEEGVKAVVKWLLGLENMAYRRGVINEISMKYENRRKYRKKINERKPFSVSYRQRSWNQCNLTKANIYSTVSSIREN